ncbi:hypothetical protein Tco_1299595, partial [Tanacetum coccineum]
VVNRERDQRKRLIQFLMGLDECYANVKGQVLLMQPLPTVVKAYSMIRQEEKQREWYIPQSTTPVALSPYSNYSRNNQYNNIRGNRNYSQGESLNRSYNQKKRRSTFKKGIICGNCSKEGHSREECYKIVGYPIGHPLYGNKCKDGPIAESAQPDDVNDATELKGTNWC